MRSKHLAVGALAALGAIGPGAETVARADSTVHKEGEVPADGLDHFFVPFDVPAGTTEIEVRHDDLSEENILDFGLLDPNGYRGWGGGTEEPAVVGVGAASRAYVPGPIPAGVWQVVVGKAKIAQPPGRYSIDITLRDAPTLDARPGRGKYTPSPALESAQRFYAGDFHVHSMESTDARPPIDEIAAFAKMKGLDFVELSDHNTVTQDDFISDAQSRHPDLLILPGIEYTTYHGHANAIGATQWIDHKIGQPGVTIDGAIEQTHAQGALFSINHPMLDVGDLCIGCAWTYLPAPKGIDAIEIETGGLKEAGFIFIDKVIDFWESKLADGSRIVPIGGSDDHKAGVDLGQFQSPIASPTTLIWADELSAKGIVDGIKRGRTVVKLQGPDDPMVELESLVPTTTDTVSAKSTRFVAKVSGAPDDAELVWVVNGESQEAIPVRGGDATFELDRQAPETGEDRVRVEVHVGGKRRTMTSYLWLQRDPAGPDYVADHASDDGCQIGGGARGSVVLLVALVGLLGWKRRRRSLAAS